MTHRTIDVGEVKARISRILQDVRGGAEWLVTDDGRPVARITPVAPPVATGTLPLEERVRRPEEQGIIARHDDARRRPLPPPLPLPQDLAQRFLGEDRRR